MGSDPKRRGARSLSAGSPTDTVQPFIIGTTRNISLAREATESQQRRLERRIAFPASRR